MANKKTTEDRISKIGPDGKSIPLSAKEDAEARAALRRTIETGKVEVAPEAEEQLKALGLSLDDVLAQMIGKHKH